LGEFLRTISSVFANAGITDVGNFTAVQAQLPPPKPNLIAADVNLIGTVYTCYLAIHYLRRNPNGSGGSIITTSSGAGLYAAPPIPIYSAAKHGVVGLTRSLSYTLRPENIFVHCVLPGAVKTNIVDPESMKDFPEDQYTSVQDIVNAVDSLLLGKFAAEGKSGRIIEVSRGQMNHRDQLPYVDEVMAKVMGQLLETAEIKSTNAGIANHSRESKI
jgi:15-hydroxyprostaglandin dehydrogenase (NAD)